MENLIERNSEELKIDNYIRICHRGGGSERLNVERSKFGTLYQTKSMNIQRNPLRETINNPNVWIETNTSSEFHVNVIEIKCNEKNYRYTGTNLRSERNTQKHRKCSIVWLNALEVEEASSIYSC